MSLLPYFLEDQLSDDDFFFRPRNRFYGYNRFPTKMAYLRPGSLSSPSQSGLSHIQNDENNFKVNLDVQQFKPNEVSVKVVDGFVVVDGKHEERSDGHGYISRQFTRRYKIPDNVDPDRITSSLSLDGILSVGAPKKTLKSAKGEIPIQIIQTNEPSIKGAPNKSKENNKTMESN